MNNDFPTIVINSPGRINLIGEHIDYNGGFVLLGTIEQSISIILSENGTDTCNIRSEKYKSGFSVPLDMIERSSFHWHNYILGVITELQELDLDAIRGFDCIIKSNLPMGGGISSSAALECGIAKGLNELFALGKTDEQLIRISRDAEHNFVGTKCGIMDQFAVIMGKRDTLIKLNCDTLEHSYVAADFGPFEIILLNTNVSHNLADSEYNRRRAECFEALEIINRDGKEYPNLCDVPLKIVMEKMLKLPKPLFKRALYAVEENERTQRAASLLEKGKLELFGKLMYASHQGLRSLYEVSCVELDFLVDYSNEFPSVIGSRMMGGGFGGCTINLVHREGLQDFVSKASNAYSKEFNIELTPIKVKIGDGVTVARKGQ